MRVGDIVRFKAFSPALKARFGRHERRIAIVISLLSENRVIVLTSGALSGWHMGYFESINESR